MASQRDIDDAIRKIGILENELEHTKEDLERENAEMKRELQETKAELATVTAKVTRFESLGKHVGFFWLGVIAFGYVVSDGFDKWKEKLSKLLSWVIS